MAGVQRINGVRSGREPGRSCLWITSKQYSDTEAGARLALAGPQLQKSAVASLDPRASRSTPGADSAGEPLYSAKARSASCQ